MKHRIWLLALVFVVTAAPAPADDIFIPNNKVQGGGNVIPFGGVWPSSSNPLGEFTYQWWIPAASMGGKVGRITAIAALPRQTATHSAVKAELKMSHNTLSTYSTIFAQNLPTPVTLHPEGPWTWNAVKDTWSLLPLPASAGFVYNGTDNLTIQVRFYDSKVVGAPYVDCWDERLSSSASRIYLYGSGAYNATSSRSTTNLGLKLRLTLVAVSLTGSGAARPGGTVTLSLFSPADPGLPYQVGTSLGTGPIPIGTRNLNLSLDNLLLVTVRGVLPMVFKNYAGLLDTSGKAAALIVIPNIPALVGVRLHSAFLTLKAGAPQNIASISGNYSFTISS